MKVHYPLTEIHANIHVKSYIIGNQNLKLILKKNQAIRYWSFKKENITRNGF